MKGKSLRFAAAEAAVACGISEDAQIPIAGEEIGSRVSGACTEVFGAEENCREERCLCTAGETGV